MKKAIILIATISQLMQGAQMQFNVSSARFLQAVAARENGTYTWTKRGEYGPHQIKTGITRDWAKAVKFVHLLTELVARDWTVQYYQDIAEWHAERILSNARLRVDCATDRDLVITAACAWKRGIAGAINGKGLGDTYPVEVANLYEAL